MKVIINLFLTYNKKIVTLNTTIKIFNIRESIKH